MSGRGLRRLPWQQRGVDDGRTGSLESQARSSPVAVMLPPKEHVQQQQQQQPRRTTGKRPACSKRKPRSSAVNWNVLAERNYRVAPVGAWVEGAEDEQEESLAFATAAQIEEECKEQRDEKERVLKHFQEEVKRRVNQHVKLRKKQQFQQSCEAALKESTVVTKFSDSALQLTPKKSTCVYRYSKDSAIGSSGSKLLSVQQPSDVGEWEEVQDPPFLEQAKTQLASSKTTPAKAEEGDSGELSLEGYHDLPAELQEQGPQIKGLYCSQELETVASSTAQGTCQVGALQPAALSSSAHGTEAPAPLVLWPGIENEESKKQRQNQYLRYRRLFMDIEREQVKEQQRQKEWQKKMEKIKREKEHCRLAEEERLQEKASQGASSSGHKTYEKLEKLKLEDVKEKRKVVEKQQRNKEYSRYVEALRAQMREKIKMYKIDLPPLCFCGIDFWDCHPDSCANNCVFYKNHKAYAEALQSVISSFDAGSTTKLSVHTFATVHARSGKNS
ncbi:hypothetical protein lerEdw1_019875 [Lerista edwardsae]|nr:hypothetical protein lerEdw1_019875 [Lerista edwardsae]